MGLFSRKRKKEPAKEPYAVVFICRGPDPSGITNIISGFSMTSRGLYEIMVKFGFTGERDHLIMFSPDWNHTVYSSSKLREEGEVEDLRDKIINKLKQEGFTYNGEDIRTCQYDPSTGYGQMGLFMAYVFIEK